MNKGARTFEDLRIWQEARNLVKTVYALTGPDSKARKDWGFRDQIQRASISIMNNIAEGFEKASPAEFAHMLAIAKGSCGEVRSMTYVAVDLEYISEIEAHEFQTKTIAISRGIAALIAHLRGKSK